jgi:TRAP-type uncharacterized transport system substrate-binding protein
MLNDNILGVGLEVAELALEALDLEAVLAGDVDAQLYLGGEGLPAVGAEDVARQAAALKAPVMLDVHVIPCQEKQILKLV